MQIEAAQLAAAERQSKAGLQWTGGMAPCSLWQDTLDSSNQGNKGLAKLPQPVSYTRSWQMELTGLSTSVQGHPLQVSLGTAGQIEALQSQGVPALGSEHCRPCLAHVWKAQKPERSTNTVPSAGKTLRTPKANPQGREVFLSPPSRTPR